MALLVEGSLANVYASLDAYCLGTLSFLGTNIVLHGVRRFVRPADLPWVELHYDFLGLQEQYLRQVGGGNFGVHRLGYLQVDLYQRMRTFTQRYTIATVRDNVVAAFPEGGLVPIYDYTDNPEPTYVPLMQVGNLIVDGLKENLVDRGDTDGLLHHVIRVNTRYLEQFTRS